LYNPSKQALIGIAHLGLDGQCLWINQDLTEIVGYTCYELNQRSLTSITHPDDLIVDREYMRQMLAGEIQSYVVKKRYIRKDNTSIWVNLTVSLVRIASEKPYVVYVVQDLTDWEPTHATLPQGQENSSARTIELEQVNEELQTALEELRVTQEELHQQNEELVKNRQMIERERQHYQDLFEFAPDGYLVTDVAVKIQQANFKVASLLSTQKQNLINKPLAIFIAK
jgi:PAS domain S-box-containing protein